MTGANTKTWIKMGRLGKLENKSHYVRITSKMKQNRVLTRNSQFRSYFFAFSCSS